MNNMTKASVYLFLFILGACGGGGSSSTNESSKPAVNNPPQAVADSYDVGMNVSTVLDVTANDNDQDSFSVSAYSEPQHGTLLINNNNLVYTPETSYVGDDSFSYTITDSAGQQASAEVSLSVANLPPNANNDLVEINQNQQITLDVLVNDSSAAGHELTVVSTSMPSHGTLVQSDNDFIYTPVDGFAGEDSFVYVVTDSYGDQNTATVAITVNNLLPVVSDDAQIIEQNQQITIDVLANDSDVVGDDLTLTSVSASSLATVAIVDNKLLYTPTLGQAGEEVLTYTVTDQNNGEVESTVAITINNVLPVANDDIAYVAADESIEIDPLANDIDVEGDTLTILSHSSPAHGSVTLSNNRLVYQAESGYVGDDSFGYTFNDSHGAVSSGFITVKVRKNHPVSGRVIGYVQEGLAVKLTVGTEQVTVYTDAEGNYTATIPVVSPDTVITASVNINEQYQLNAYLGSVGDVYQQVDQALAPKVQNISDVTTAEYELISLVLEGEQAATSQQLIKAQFKADSFYLLQMTIAAQLINADNGLNLPEGFSSVNEFIKSTVTMRQQLARWRDTQGAIYHRAFNDLFDGELTVYPDRLSNGEHYLATQPSIMGSSYPAGYFSSLTLNGNNANYVSYEEVRFDGVVNTHDDRIELEFTTKTHDSGYISIYSRWVYCQVGEVYQKARVRPNFDNMVLAKLFSTKEYDVYIYKANFESESDVCFDDKVMYNVLRHYHGQEHDLADKAFYIDSMSKKIGNDFSDWHAANFHFDEDGTFEDLLNQRNGTWRYENKVLSLFYPNNTSLHYQKLTSLMSRNYYSMVLKRAETTIESSSSFLVPDKPFTWHHSAGYMYSALDTMPDLEDLFNVEYRTHFKSNGELAFQELVDGQWQDSETFGAKWEKTGNVYVYKAYYLNNRYVESCDITLEECKFRKYLSLEVVGRNGNKYDVLLTRFREDYSSGELYQSSNYLTQRSFVPE
ncbi:Ig-like domain-containing protein [Thalassotalea ganghwensis]